MSSNTKTRLLNDLESLRHQLAELEAYDANPELTPSNIEAITSLDADNIPLLGDAVLIDPASREEAISVRREAVAHLDFALKELESELNELHPMPEQDDSLAENTTLPPASDEYTTQSAAPSQLIYEDVFLDETDSFEYMTSESSILGLNESDDEDPLSPPPNLSAHIQSESLILEIPVKQEPKQAMGESATSLPVKNTQTDLMQAPTQEEPTDEKSDTFEASAPEDLLNSEPEPKEFAATDSLSASLLSTSLASSRPAIQPVTHQGSPEITANQADAINPTVNATTKSSLFTPKSQDNLGHSSKLIQPKVTIQAHTAGSPETKAVNNTLSAFLQTESIMMNTTKEQPPVEPTSLQANAEDNPFLPQYLRERLSKSKSSLLEEIARSSESLNASTALLRNFEGRSHATHSGSSLSSQKTHHIKTSPEHQAIVDHLVAKYLPIIEADLRQRLHSSINQQNTHSQKTNNHLTPETT